MTLDYWTLFFLDLVIWATCLIIMLRFGRLALLHPGSLYFFFHIYTFTFRLFQLANGAPTLFAGWGPSFSPVTFREIQRASVVAWISLVTMTIVWLYSANKSPQLPPTANALARYRPFDKRLMWMVVGITLPIGLIALIAFRLPIIAGAPGLSVGEWSSSGYLFSMTQWFGISLLALIFYYGFRRILLILFTLYLIVALLAFPFRAIVIIPALFVVFAYLDRNRGRRLSLRLIISVLILSLVFIAGKELGPILREGDFDRAWDLITGRLTQMQTGEHRDAMFMDQMAIALSQVDERGEFFYGRTYVNILVLPIPRQLWPDKPGQADWQKELQTLDRPTGTMGAIVTALGEAYANFGYPGIILYSVMIAVLLYKLYGWMSRAPYYSLVNFWSLCVYAILIQVFRDGLISFVTFQVSMFMPLTIITLFHILFLRRRVGRCQTFLGWTTIFDRFPLSNLRYIPSKNEK